MSRIIVRNLHSSISLSEFRTHFSTVGAKREAQPLTVTDARLPSKRDGTLRRFGFIGYKTPEEARRAKDWFDGTYVGTSKVEVEVVADGLKGEPPTKRRRLNPQVGESSHLPASEPAELEEPTAEEQKSGKNKKEKKPKFKGPSWANEPFEVPVAGSSKVTAPSKKAGNTEGKRKERKAKDVQESAEEDTADVDQPISDLEWMKRRMTDKLEPGGEGGGELDEEGHEKAPVETEIQVDPRQQEMEQAKEIILSTSRLFLRNLTFTVTTEELEEAFSSFGELEQVHIPLSKEHKPIGLAYITFKHAHDAVRAYEEMDGGTFQGRLLHVLPAIDRKPAGAGPEESGKTLREMRLESKKKLATKGQGWEWGVLYMNTDAVATSVASRFGILKTDILHEGEESGSTNPAVKLALAETHIINETKQYLSDQGIHLDAFSSDQPSSSRSGRSRTTILVKNIPYGTSAATLRSLFEPHGDIRRLVIPPSGTIAVLEYTEPYSADAAIKAVSYRRLGNSVIYLERAPPGVWKTSAPDGAVTRQSTSGLGLESAGVKPVAIASNLKDGESTPAGTTLYVKNLSFGTTTDGLNRAFRHLPGFAFARVATKPDPKNPSRLSMGYGFVGLSTVDAANMALKSMDGFILDGHKLVVKFAGRGTEDDVVEVAKGEKAKSKTTKMIVKNVPFEASKKDIRQLFGAHGQLKSVRLPKRFDSRSRGFAFLEFITRREAENAYASLKHTHLLGRHLVLEWVEDDETNVERLREKVALGFGDGKAVPGKKRKLVMGGEDVEVED